MLSYPELLHGFPSIVQTVKELTADDSSDAVLNELSIDRNVSLLQSYQRQVESWLANLNQQEVQQRAVELIDFMMRVFHAENVTGELSDAEAEALCDVLSRFHIGAEVEARFLQRLLTIDGEMPASSVRYSALLLASLALVRAKVDGGDLFPFTNIWRLRVVFRHQLCVQRRSHSLFHDLASCIEALENDEALLTAHTLIEVGHVQNYYHRRDLAASCFLSAMKKTGLRIEESAIRGVRTRWQQHTVVQAVLNATSLVPVEPVDPSLDQPVEVGGEKSGHDLLDRPKESSDDTDGSRTVALKPLAAVDKAIILALCEGIHYDNPHHGLTKHHMQIYLERLIVDPATAPYLIRAQLLLARARLENGRSRVAERAFMQFQELVDAFSAKRNPTLATFHRTDSAYFYLVAFPCVWRLKREFADICMEENLHKTALDLYEQIQDWEKIIACCKQLDKRKKAENLARELLEKDPLNPMLWVALGEATREDSYLWKAWELSRHKMAAPMRALARLALEREHYEKVVQYFEESVRINPIFGGDWFTLGFASMRLKDYSRSGEAFTRVCQIDPNDAFAWNNLASIMLQQGRKRPAFNAMSQALRNNRRSWRMWQNYFSIGVELLEVAEATHALSVALDIAQRQMTFEASSMKLFVQAAIRFMKGEIKSTDNVIPGETGGDDAIVLPCTTHANEVADGGDLEVTGLAPLAGDVEMPANFFPEKAQKQREAEEAARLGAAARYGERVRDVFKQILELFVNDEDLYHCAAELHRYLDGPLEAFELRQKELRCTQQTEQWNRTDDLFRRVAECLFRMEADVSDALSLSLSSDAASSAHLAAKALLLHIDGVLHQSGEHLEHTAVYRDVMLLRKRVAGLCKPQ